MFRVMADKCHTCIFHPGNRMNLREGRVQEMVAKTDRTDTNVICHQSEHLMGKVDGEVYCAGSVQRLPGQLARIAQRLGCVQAVTPPAESPRH